MPVAFIIISLFALPNTCILFKPGIISHVSDRSGLGILLGLFAGKPLGVFLLSWIAIRFRIGRLQKRVTLNHLHGAGLLGRIGFTMFVFIILLAFPYGEIISVSQISIVIASLRSGIAGLCFLFLLKPVDIQQLQ